MRNPAKNPTPLDWASFYVEDVKFGATRGQLEPVEAEDAARELQVLLDAAKDAAPNMPPMTGEELMGALRYYAESYQRQLPAAPLFFMYSLLLDGLMHGIAYAAGLRGEHRRFRYEGDGEDA